MKHDPTKPTYQTNWLLPDCVAKTHPGLSIVQIDPVDPAKVIRQNELQRGANMMWWGMWVAIVCVVVHACSSIKPLKRVAEYGITGGVLAIIGGMLYKQMVEHEKIIFLVGGVAFAWWLLSHKKIRDWSISHIISKPIRSGSQSDNIKGYG